MKTYTVQIKILSKRNASHAPRWTWTHYSSHATLDAATAHAKWVADRYRDETRVKAVTLQSGLTTH